MKVTKLFKGYWAGVPEYLLLYIFSQIPATIFCYQNGYGHGSIHGVDNITL